MIYAGGLIVGLGEQDLQEPDVALHELQFAADAWAPDEIFVALDCGNTVNSSMLQLLLAIRLLSSAISARMAIVHSAPEVLTAIQDSPHMGDLTLYCSLDEVMDDLEHKRTGRKRSA